MILTPTTSLAGNLQVVARVLEVALHKAHELGFPLKRIVDGEPLDRVHYYSGVDVVTRENADAYEAQWKRWVDGG